MRRKARKNKSKVIIIGVIILIVAFVWGKSKRNATVGDESDNAAVISSVDDIYSAMSSKITHLKNLPEDYDIYAAVEDGCMVVMGNTYNSEPMDEFMELYNKKESAFARVAQLTDEGDLVLYDVVYIPEKGKVYVITDYTRDEFSAKEDKKISFKEYEKIATDYNGKKCWIAYNGELSNNKEDNIFYIVSSFN